MLKPMRTIVALLVFFLSDSMCSADDLDSMYRTFSQWRRGSVLELLQVDSEGKKKSVPVKRLETKSLGKVILPYWLDLPNGHTVVSFSIDREDRSIFFGDMDTGSVSVVFNDPGRTAFWPRIAYAEKNHVIYLAFSTAEKIVKPSKHKNLIPRGSVIKLYRSGDGGKRWDWVADIGAVAPDSGVASDLFQPSITVLSDGSLGLTVTNHDFNLCQEAGNAIDYIEVYRSTDGGKTWPKALRRQVYHGSCVLANGRSASNNESCLTQLSDGRLVVVFRSSDKVRPGDRFKGAALKLSVSKDMGLSWQTSSNIIPGDFPRANRVPVFRKTKSRLIIDYVRTTIAGGDDWSGIVSDFKASVWAPIGRVDFWEGDRVLIPPVSSPPGN